MAEKLVQIVVGCWLLAGEMAPYLLFGFLVAGLLSVCISPVFVERHLGGSGIGPIVKASLFGVPLPLCSCSVIPVSASIRQHGASRGATTAFLLSTPQTGVDSIAVTYGLLGPVLAIVRPLVALATGLLGGALVAVGDRGSEAGERGAASGEEDSRPETRDRSATVRVRDALHHGFVVLPRDIGGALLVGLAISGILSAVVPPDLFPRYLGSGLFAVLVAIALSIPLYVCATASVPIALGMIHVGVSPGAALAFLIAGPATNAATVATVWRLLGRRSGFIYLGTVAAVAVVCGLLIDTAFPNLTDSLPIAAEHCHKMANTAWTTHVWAATLLLLLVATSRQVDSLAKMVAVDRKPRATSCGCSADSDACDSVANDDDSVTIAIAGMSCQNCVRNIRRALLECPGVEAANVNLEFGQAIVRGEGFDARQLVDRINALGFSASVGERGP
jgi:uncharacterized membrane protein YraQ (UPF0718 family)/copper chaperone CopZ